MRSSVCTRVQGADTASCGAGRQVRSFQVAEKTWEVSHARVYHSGVVALAYPPQPAKPRLMLTTWQQPLTDAEPSPPVTLNGGAALTARNGGGSGGDAVPMFGCMALQAGPPIATGSAMPAGGTSLQVRLVVSRFTHWAQQTVKPGDQRACFARSAPGCESLPRSRRNGRKQLSSHGFVLISGCACFRSCLAMPTAAYCV